MSVGDGWPEVSTTANTYTNKTGEAFVQTAVLLPAATKQRARELRMNVSAICSRAIEAAVREAEHGAA